MAIPALSAEARADGLRTAAATRRERAELRKALKSGSLALEDLLDRDDDVVARMRVLYLLRSLPGVGAIGATKLMGDLDISENRRVQGMGANQRACLLARFGRNG